MAEWEKDPEVPAWQKDPLAKPELSTAGTLADVGEQGLRGYNQGLAGLMTLPYEAMRYVLDKGVSIPGIGTASPGIKMTPAEDLPMWRPFLKHPEAQTDAGRYARAAGEVVGASTIPSGMLLGTANRAAGPAANTVDRVLQTMRQPYAAAPGSALAADVVSGTAAGLGQEGAKEAGFGPAGQATIGMITGAAPFALKSLYDVPAGWAREAKANASPHAKVAGKLGDLSVDDLSANLAVGNTRQNQALAQRVYNTIGEEMVRANGDWPAAQPNIIARLVREGNVAPATAREQLRRVMGSQADSELFLGEYPTVVASNEATRTRDADVLLNELNAARTMPDRDAAAILRRNADPGRTEDSNVHWMMDTIANNGGTGATTVRRAIDDRLSALGDQAAQRVQNWSPNGQLTDDAAAAIEQIRRAGNAAYRAVYDAPGGTAVNYPLLHGLLPRVVERHLRRLAGYNGDQAEALRSAINRLYVTRPAGVASREALPGLEDELAAARTAVREARRQGQPKAVRDDLEREAERIAEQLRLTRRDSTPPTQQYLLPTLEQLQNSRSGIFGDLQGYRADPGRGHLLPIVEPLYRDITRIMERSSPAWRTANRQWADLRIDMVARELGENIAEKAGPNFRQQMREFNRLAPAAQDFVRIEMAQKLMDKLQNLGDGDNIAKIFKTPHMKELVRTMFGDEAAVDMRRMVRDLNVATRSKNMMHGSPTQPRLARKEELNADLEILSAEAIPTTVGEFLKSVRKYTIGKFEAARNAQIGQILATPVRNTARTAEHIERMRQAQALAARYARPYSSIREAFGAALRKGQPSAGIGEGIAVLPDSEKP